MYTINTQKPIPAHPSAPRYERYPFRNMDVGHSFDFKSEAYKNVYSAAKMYGNRNGKEFVIKSNRDGTCTCWRKS